MFVRNKIPRYSSCPTPSSSSSSSPSLFTPVGNAHRRALVPFYLRKVSTPSASTLHTSSPSVSLSLSLVSIPPPPRETTLYATRNLPSYTSYEAEDGSDGGSYGINKSGAHAPQLPSLLPSAAATSPPPPSLLRGPSP